MLRDPVFIGILEENSILYPFYPLSVALFDSLLTLLPDNNLLDWSKFKLVADDKFNVAEIMISVLDLVESIVGKGENAGYQHFLLFPQCFQKASSSGSLKVGFCGKGLIYMLLSVTH